MNKKRLLLLITILLFTSSDYSKADRPAPVKKNRQPDIVFVLLDDLRFDGLSFMGHPYVKTPNIDELCKLGVSMKNAFVTTSICCPSRATFLTGLYANKHGVIDNEAAEYGVPQGYADKWYR